MLVGPERALATHPDVRGRVHLAEPVADLGPVSAEHGVAESGVRTFVVPWHQLPDGRTVAAHPIGGNQVSWRTGRADRLRRDARTGRPPDRRPRALRAAPPDHHAARAGSRRPLDPRGRRGERRRCGRGGRTDPVRQDPAGQPPGRRGPGRRRRRRRLPGAGAGRDARDARPRAVRGGPRGLPAAAHPGGADRRRRRGAPRSTPPRRTGSWSAPRRPGRRRGCPRPVAGSARPARRT